MIKLKSMLKEGFAWERKADGSLPTLKDTTAAHAHKIQKEAAYENLTRNELADYVGKLSVELKNETNPDKIKLIKQDIEEVKAKLKEKGARWQDSDGDGKWYEPGQDVKINEFSKVQTKYETKQDLQEKRDDHSLLDLVSTAEDIVQNLRRNMATNSVLRREEKMGYLRAYDDLLDVLSDIGYQAEMHETE